MRVSVPLSARRAYLSRLVFSACNGYLWQGEGEPAPVAGSASSDAEREGGEADLGVREGDPDWKTVVVPLMPGIKTSVSEPSPCACCLGAKVITDTNGRGWQLLGADNWL